MAIKPPGGAYASRPKHFIWLLDCSTSMRTDGKIEALNAAVDAAIPAMLGAAETNSEAQLLVRVVKFATGADWHVADPTPIGDFHWSHLEAGGETHMGKAFALVAEELRALDTASRLLPPALVLVSDGQPTDHWRQPLDLLLSLPWGARAERYAIAIGRDADQAVLQRFINDPERRPLRADNPEALVSTLRWVSTSVAGTNPDHAPPHPPQPDYDGGGKSVW